MWLTTVNRQPSTPEAWGIVLNIMHYMGRLRPNGVHLSGWMYIKVYGFPKLKYREGLGKLSFRYLKAPFKNFSKHLASRYVKGIRK